jgi:thiol:disulfide interchange protein DsbD
MKLLFTLLVLCSSLFAEIVNPVKWNLTSKKINDCEYQLIFNGIIDEHWHLYSLNLSSNEGPVPSRIEFVENADFELIGKPTENTPIKSFDKVFNVEVAYFEKTVTFIQKIKLKTNKQATIKGSYAYQVCTEDQCNFPPAKLFEFKLTGTDTCFKKSETVAKTEKVTILPSQTFAAASNEYSIEGKAWWLIYLTGFFWGFAALFTPCVFPLIPMNMSFFLKRKNTNGKLNALIYALSIIVIFVALGLIISVIWGGGALLSFSSSVGFNGVVFILLLLFAASFLGAFEIVLPSKFVNKIDAQSDKGGFMGIFFMALTLVVVSFSCTGPMVGNALVAASTSQNTSGAFWAMFGFSSGLALPFGFFAFFPSLLKSIPKSGGWLNAVKVTLGFLELALALKFASNIDLAYHLGILTREVFITLWIGIFTLMSIYLLGGFKTSHDSEVKHLSVARIFVTLTSLSFAIYLIPGLWGAPLKLLSGVLPPFEYSESPHGFGAAEKNNSQSFIDPEFAPYIKTNKNGIVHFTNDYTHALAYAKKVNKPLLVDFTGYTCANCRKTEDFIWPDATVKNMLNNEVVLVSLYVDDKLTLNKKDIENVFWNGDNYEITTLGDKFKYMEENTYKTNALPFYILLNGNEKPISPPRFYQSGIAEYAEWLKNGITLFNK